MVARDWHRIVGGWQILGGVAGAITILERMPRAGLSVDTKAVIYLTVPPFCALSALAGWSLIRGQALGRARSVSVVIGILQLVGFRLEEVAYRLALGPYVFLNIIPNHGIGLTAALQPHLVLYTHATGSPKVWLVVNLLAVAALSGLWRARPMATNSLQAGHD